jgi:hypothetical protein
MLLDSKTLLNNAKIGPHVTLVYKKYAKMFCRKTAKIAEISYNSDPRDVNDRCTKMTHHLGENTITYLNEMVKRS